MQDSAVRSTRSRLAFGASPRERVGAVWRRNGALAFFLGLELLCAPALALAQAIKPDGRTATTVTTVGAVTKVTTATVSNANAFNSFQTFGVAAGTTANLYVPNGATNLINIVRDQRTDIYGVLNAIKNGQIGGNVWFANPNGFLVGASGVVNVGSLTVTTPTPAFVDGFFSSPGTPNQASVTQLLERHGAAQRVRGDHHRRPHQRGRRRFPERRRGPGRRLDLQRRALHRLGPGLHRRGQRQRHCRGVQHRHQGRPDRHRRRQRRHGERHHRRAGRQPASPAAAYRSRRATTSTCSPGR